MRGMALTGPARPAADLELSDHGCGLRVYECRDRCVRDEDKPEEVDLFKMYEAASEFWKHPGKWKSGKSGAPPLSVLGGI